MKRKKNKIRRFLKYLYLKTVRINDSPQKIALGFGLGVFFGVLPCAGIIFTLLAASLFKMNRASALLGVLATNTWISFATFLLSIKAGAVIMGLDWHHVQQSCNHLLKDFHFADLFKLSFLEIMFPVVIGYMVVSLCFGILAYLVSLTVIVQVTHAKTKIRIKFPR
jgi:uncharacterized protein (DUF2062 family)